MDQPVRGMEQEGLGILIGRDYYWNIVSGHTERLDNGEQIRMVNSRNCVHPYNERNNRNSGCECSAYQHWRRTSTDFPTAQFLGDRIVGDHRHQTEPRDRHAT